MPLAHSWAYTLHASWPLLRIPTTCLLETLVYIHSMPLGHSYVYTMHVSWPLLCIHFACLLATPVHTHCMPAVHSHSDKTSLVYTRHLAITVLAPPPDHSFSPPLGHSCVYRLHASWPLLCIHNACLLATPMYTQCMSLGHSCVYTLDVSWPLLCIHIACLLCMATLTRRHSCTLATWPFLYILNSASTPVF